MCCAPEPTMSFSKRHLRALVSVSVRGPQPWVVGCGMLSKPCVHMPHGLPVSHGFRLSLCTLPVFLTKAQFQSRADSQEASDKDLLAILVLPYI